LKASDETLFVTALARIAAAILFAVTGNHLTAAEPGAGLELKQTIPLPGVEGRIDHFDFDPAGERLFVCALGNNTVEVLDLRQGERVHSISGLGSPQGLAYVPELSRLFVANDKGGLCNIYDAKSWRLIGTADFQDDADNWLRKFRRPAAPGPAFSWRSGTIYSLRCLGAGRRRPRFGDTG